ncbi:phage tail protein [Pseudomonas siliginis]|uniref:phage tail protein n=1 Tax=Pseudomonas siliginis TaxID=2842346 RepID=UPI002092ADCD|nr:phage tail protein [Pseudomonas siliginis]UST93756.1 phage tail protein [Pseudomonas siliginis]
MTDANSQFFAILTSVGKAKQANADALGIPWLITQMGVGDANNIDPVIPAEGQTKLINEWRRKPLNRLFVDPVNPAVLIAEQIIPADEGGRWIREIGLYDADGDLVAVANCAPSFKPLLSQGSGRTQIVRMNFIVTSTGNIQLKIDPAVVLATRAFVEAAILEVLPKNKTPGQWTRVKTNDRGIVVEGDNPDTLAGMGIKDTYTKTQIEAMIAAASALPVGVMAPIPVDKIPPGFLELDGSVKSIAVYPDLATFLGTAFNKGDEGVGNFRLPDSRGEFLRGWDHGRGVDVGRVVGSSQKGTVTVFDSNQSVTPTVEVVAASVAAAQADVFVASDYPGVKRSVVNTGVQPYPDFADAGVMRPRNVAVMWCIKAWNAPINQGNIDIQALAALATQATEVKLGAAKIATQALTDAGMDDATIVTPKKLRWGFQILKASNGYIVFPSWLGGLVIQWGIFTGNGTNDLAVPYPIQFPNAAFVVQATLQYTPSSPVNGYVDVSQGVSKTSFWAKHTFSGPTTINWLAIGH